MKLSRQIIRDLIHEEISKNNNRILWEQKRIKIINIQNKLLEKGHSKQRIDEYAASALAGLFSRGVGLGGSEFTDSDSESIFGGDLAGGVRVAIEQTILEKIVTTMGLDPYTGFGLILKNALERAIRKFTSEGGDLTQLFSGQDCRAAAAMIAKEALIIVEESSKERILKLALDSIGGELGVGFQNSPFFKPIYQGMREKFSSAFDDLIDEEAYSQNLADVICKHMNVSSILGNAADFAGGEISDAAGEIGGMFTDAFSGFFKE